MTDILEYSDVAFPRERFADDLLAELLAVAPSVVEFDGDHVVIKHLYIERRMTPLNIYLERADDAQRAHAMREYGDALKELAAVNIFAGDLLFKNFGVTRFGRVVFYDYDEIEYLTDCSFRRIPPPPPATTRCRATSGIRSGRRTSFRRSSRRSCSPTRAPAMLHARPRRPARRAVVAGDAARDQLRPPGRGALVSGQRSLSPAPGRGVMTRRSSIVRGTLLAIVCSLLGGCAAQRRTPRKPRATRSRATSKANAS
jgi:hypothetical protein